MTSSASCPISGVGTDDNTCATATGLYRDNSLALTYNFPGLI